MVIEAVLTILSWAAVQVLKVNISNTTLMIIIISLIDDQNIPFSARLIFFILVTDINFTFILVTTSEQERCFGSLLF